MTSPANIKQKVNKRKVLVLHGLKTQQPSLLEPLEKIFNITAVSNVEQALELLKSQHFDAVFSQTADFLPLERESAFQQATAILNTIGEGVCIVDVDGTLLWENQQMQSLDEPIRKSISHHSQQAYQFFQNRLQVDVNKGLNDLRSRKYSFTDEQSNRYFEMITTPMLDSKNNITQVATVIWEATSSRRLQQRIDAIDKAGRELVRLEAESITSMTVEQRISLVQDKIIRYAKRLLHFDHFVVRLLNRQSNQLEVLFGVALPQDMDMELFANSENNGITGYVGATGRSYICNNPENDPRYKDGLDSARCSLTVPLRLHDKVIGTLNVESDKEAAFNEDDRQVAEIFGRYIAIALNILDLLVVERFQTTGQATDNLCHELSEPLNQIMTQASLVMEDYIGHDDIRRRLQGVIDNITTIKQTLKEASAGPRGIIGTRRKDATMTSPELMGKLVLVVDDEQFIRQTIADVLEKCGSSVDTAQDGREAIALIKNRQYDLVLSDIKLPYASGYEVFAAAHAAQSHVVLMTGFGYDPNHSIVRANREGLSAVLYKPFKADQMLTTICKTLSQSKPRG
ncbi:MAG: response regulator [Planctomycetes bacterium]|nr:response regulator [Planctomycetota bacterium]